MEEPGYVRKRAGRIKTNILVLSSCFLLLLIMAACNSNNKTATMEKRASVKGRLQTTNGKPVADAIVMIKEGSHEFNDMAAMSNEQGEFYVNNIVIPGWYILQIQHDSGSITKKIEVNSPNDSFVINF
jgi:hypothetical protein